MDLPSSFQPFIQEAQEEPKAEADAPKAKERLGPWKGHRLALNHFDCLQRLATCA